MKETKILTRRLGKYDPPDLDAYKALGGLEGLRRALAAAPERIIEQIRQSKLTGRGGAAFGTGLKWQLAAQQKQTPKYFICNGEEGEPGTFKDKVLLDGDPWAVLEGIIIAAFAIGAEQAYIYIRGAYEDTFELWQKIAAEAKAQDLLGPDILGSQFGLSLHVVKARGLYITGEESALISSLELGRPMTTLKPPYPVQQGLFGKPTVVNNVETIANVPVILAKGPEQYLKLGTEAEPGTRLFSLSGDVRQPGVYEIETGSGTLGELIDEFGGGTKGDKPIKAVQPGGASTALLAADSLDCLLTGDDIRRAGSQLATAGVIVYDLTRGALDILKGLFDFFGGQSCGRCTPCRIGVVKTKQILDKIAAGRGSAEDVRLLKEINQAALAASACGMGLSFPLPLLSALRLFPQDFEKAIARTKA